MKKIKNLFILMLAITVAVSCNQVTYKKTPGGMPFRIFPGTGNTPIKVGNFIKFNIMQKINDSVYFNSAEKMPIYTRVSERTRPYDLSELWTKLKLGDSVVATQMLDTFIKRSPGMIPPQLKKGDRLMSYIKILNVFNNDSSYEADLEKEKDAKLKSEVAFMEKYIADKKIKAERTPSGAFVEIINPGEGPVIDSGKYVMVKYRGTTFSGKIFDSNMDSTYGKKDPLGFTVDGSPMIKGFTECIKFLRKGAVAKFYIPSMLGYGEQASGGIQPFENLMFDIIITDVRDHAPAPPVQKVPAHKMDSTLKKKK